MGKISFKQRVEDVSGEIAQFCGFSQAMTYSFESPKVFDKLKLAADAEERKTVVISNPLGEDFSIMRTLPLNGMLNSLATNYNRRNKDVKLYELAKVYVPVEGEDLPDERVQFTLGFYGDGDNLHCTLPQLVADLGITASKAFFCSIATDGAYLYATILNGSQSELAVLDLKTGAAADLGSFNADVWPVVGLRTDRVTIVTSASTSSAMESTDSLPALQEAQIEALPVTAR